MCDSGGLLVCVCLFVVFFFKRVHDIAKMKDWTGCFVLTHPVAVSQRNHNVDVSSRGKVLTALGSVWQPRQEKMTRIPRLSALIVGRRSQK